MSNHETTREYGPARKQSIDSQTSGGSNYDVNHVPAPVEIASELETSQAVGNWVLMAEDLDEIGERWIGGEPVPLGGAC